MDRILYFAYGSNMLPGRLRDRIGAFHRGFVATLDGYAFAYDKSGLDGTTKANIHPDPGGHVIGVCYELDRSALKIIEGFEGGYCLITVEVLDGDRRARAHTFTSDLLIDDDAPPSTAYRQMILDGARGWGLPAEYIDATL